MIGPESLPFRKWDCQFAGFEPESVGAVAGLTTEIEEEWRRAGKMPWGMDDPQRASAVPVVALALHHELVSRGWQFENCDRLVGEGIANVFFFALLSANGACEVTGLPHLVDQFAANFMKGAELAASLTCERDKNRYLYRYGDEGRFEYGNSLQTIIDRQTLPLRLIDLQEIAIKFCDRAQVPLLCINIVDDEPKSASRVKWQSKSRV